jgi:RimJ/RimL family protein N-acetyltransferase
LPIHESQPIPTIETDRLILRSHRLDDFDAYAAIWADPDVVRFITGVPSTREQSWARLLKAAGHWHHLGFGFLAIEERRSGLLVGEAGFHDARREMVPSLDGTLEAGWLLAPQFHGKGYAREALGALLVWAETNAPPLPMTAIVHPDNERSLRLAASFGFVEHARIDYHGEVVILWRETPQDGQRNAP